MSKTFTKVIVHIFTYLTNRYIDFLKLLSDFDENMKCITLLMFYCLTLWLGILIFIPPGPWPQPQAPRPVS